MRQCDATEDWKQDCSLSNNQHVCLKEAHRAAESQTGENVSHRNYLNIGVNKILILWIN